MLKEYLNIKEYDVEKRKINISFDESYLIKKDNLSALNDLLLTHKGKIDLIYIDPPYNTKQSFSVTENRVSTISRTKIGEVAYDDNMNEKDYLTFIYNRVLILHELLSDKGSIYIHIDLNYSFYFRLILNEIFGPENFRNEITRIKSNPKNFSRRAYGNQKDIILFYTKNNLKNIWNDITKPLNEEEIKQKFAKQDEFGRYYTTIPLHAPGESNGPTGEPWRGMPPPEGRHWRTNPKEFDIMDEKGLIEWSKTGNPRIKKFSDEHKGMKYQDIWEFKDPMYPVYPTEKNYNMLELIVKQSSNEDSIVLDCFAGSGTTLLAASNNNRKFIGIDSSDEAVKIIKKKLENVSFKTIE